MCGIAGFLNFGKHREYAVQANTVQLHRGPDAQGVWSNEKISLCNQRLSIIDLSDRSNQPFEKHNLVLVYNGELYNYQEIRKHLEEQHNVVFLTRSDTEVMLEAFRIFGAACLDHFTGMFSFAIYDKIRKKLFLARDHLGIKPLYYFSKGDSFAFASELKTLTQLDEMDKAVDTYALVASLNYLWIPGQRSIFSACKKLPAAHCMQISDSGDFHLKEYWKINNGISLTSESESQDALNSELLESISRHMVADVPVSAFLSGGIDSSLIAVLAQKHNTALSTYTISTSDKDKRIEQMPEDEKYAAFLAEKFNFDHHEILIQSDVTLDLPKAVSFLDEPIGDPAAINTYLICNAARQKGVKVLLSGMGADELFFGYRRQKATLMAMQYRRLPGFLRYLIGRGVKLLPAKMGNRGFKLGRWSKRFLSFADLPLHEAYRRSYSYYGELELNDLLLDDCQKEMSELIEQHQKIFHSKFRDDPINQMCYTDTQLFMEGLNLTYTDRASMAASVEVRVPFIDKKIVELAMKIDGKLKYKAGTSKYILKKVATKYLPDKIINRPKASFGAPIRSWISSDLTEMVGDLLSSQTIQNRGILNPAYVKKLIEDDRKGKQDNAYQIYQLLTLELWFREYMDAV